MRRALFCVVPEKEHLNLCIEPDLRLRTGSFEMAFYAPAILDHNKVVTLLAYTGRKNRSLRRIMGLGTLH